MARKEPKPYRANVLVTRKGAVLAVVALVSLALHGAMVVWAWDKPVMTVSGLGEGASQARPIRVKRAAEDDYVLAPDNTPIDEGPNAEELTKQLLDSEPPQPVTEPTEVELEPRPLEELEEAATGGLELDLPAYELDDETLSQFDTRPPAELDFADDPGLGQGASGNGEGEGDGRGSGGLASDALRDAGTAPNRTGSGTGGEGEGGGGGATTSLIDRPGLDTTRDVAEPTADLDPPDDSTAIDFVDLALGDTTKIDVPDNLDDDFAYRVSKYEATDWLNRAIPLSEEPGYFRVDITAQRSLRKLKTMPKDVIYIIDTSSSISEDWVAEVTRGVNGSLVSLNEGDRFNVVLFNEKVSLLSDAGPIDATKDNTKAATDFLKSAASVGYTDVNAAMRGLLIRDADPKRVYQLVLISDGQSTRGVVNTRDLINLITRDNDLVASIYCVGVGARQNRELLNFLAYRNKGYSVYADDKREASVAIQDLMSRLRYPIIKDVRLSTLGIDSESVYPADLPNIHQGETIRVYGRYDLPTPFTMQLIGRSAGKDVAFTFKRDIADAQTGDESIANQWAFWKLHDLYALIIREGEREELLDQIKDLRRKYGLKTLY